MISLSCSSSFARGEKAPAANPAVTQLYSFATWFARLCAVSLEKPSKYGSKMCPSVKPPGEKSMLETDSVTSVVVLSLVRESEENLLNESFTQAYVAS